MPTSRRLSRLVRIPATEAAREVVAMEVATEELLDLPISPATWRAPTNLWVPPNPPKVPAPALQVVRLLSPWVMLALVQA